MKNRFEELSKLIPEDCSSLAVELIEQIVFLEDRLTELKKLPFISVNPENPMQQRNTPAAKMYKEFLQQYVNCIKLVEGVIHRDKVNGDSQEESPLRRWFNDNKQ